MNINRLRYSIFTSLVRRSGKYTVLLLAILAGMLIGLLVLFPLHEVAAYYDKGLMLKVGLLQYIFSRILDVYYCKVSLIIIEYWTIIGGLIGVLFFYIFRVIHKNSMVIRRLSTELEKSLPALLANSESSTLEFKSSLRWDYRDNKVNKNLESVITKTIAAFLNSDGGTLLIGVDDKGEVIGLDKDYENLKHKNRDGFEQAVTTLLTTKLGATVTSSILIMFHSQNGKDACRIVAMPSHRPIYVKDGSTTKFYVRTGCTTRELNLQDAVEYISMHWTN